MDPRHRFIWQAACLLLCVLAVAGEEPKRRWWQDAVVYQIYPRSFKDSDGDGVGDLPGITSKIDHLKDIGVTALWLSPIYKSPQKDFGYDIEDFIDVDPLYGTLDDFDKLQKAAKDAGLKVVLDMVPNHSSDKHPWFIASENGDPKYKDYYVWHEGKPNPAGGQNLVPNNWNSVFRGSAWRWSSKRNAYYLHQFAVEQPDLNYNNPDVVEEIKNVYRFWIDRGADGFRVDAVPYIFESSFEDEPESHDPKFDKEDNDYHIHTVTKDQPMTYDMIHQWRKVVDEYNNPDGSIDRLMMTEAYADLPRTIQYYGTKEKPGAHFTFNFLLITDVNKTSHAKDFKNAIDKWMNEMGDWRWPNWVIGNHDNSRVDYRYPEMADAINAISLTLPGTAMTYNGEEIGMTDAFIRWEETLDPQGINKGKEDYLKVSRDPCRTPFQWDDSTSAGFSTNKTTWLPANPNYWRLNLDEQKKLKVSHYSVFKDLIAARQTKTLREGDWKTEVVGSDTLKITRSLKDADTYVTLVNFGSFEETLSAADVGGENFKVYTASENSLLKKGALVKPGLKLPAKNAVVVKSGAIGLGVSSSLLLALFAITRLW